MRGEGEGRSAGLLEGRREGGMGWREQSTRRRRTYLSGSDAAPQSQSLRTRLGSSKHASARANDGHWAGRGGPELDRQAPCERGVPALDAPARPSAGRGRSRRTLSANKLHGPAVSTCTADRSTSCREIGPSPHGTRRDRRGGIRHACRGAEQSRGGQQFRTALLRAERKHGSRMQQCVPRAGFHDQPRSDTVRARVRSAPARRKSRAPASAQLAVETTDGSGAGPEIDV